MKLRDILKTVRGEQIVGIIDDRSFVCSIHGGLSEQNERLLKDYLDQEVMSTGVDFVKTIDCEIKTYFSIRLYEKDKEAL